MVDKQASFLGRHGNTYVYVPNLIGYARVLCALFAFAVALRDPYYCVTVYFIGFVLDETDGRAARTFNQSSTLGAVLDMVTDRLATAGLLAVLGMLYPRSYMAFLGLMFLDIFSHWFQMYSTFVSGSSTHKDVKSRSWLVRMYYRNRMFMGVCCISCEVLYLSLYALDWKQFREWPVLPVALPERLLRDLPDTAGLEKGLPLAAVTAALSLPGFLVKQIINCFQLRSSMQALVQYDKDREAQEVASTAAKMQ
jgi:CDP-diacylglycerol--inositol 3-phosphatidyltransferase